jgi:integrase
MTKRGNGEGSIYQRRDGRWVSSAWFGGRRRYFYARTRQEVGAKLRAAVRADEEGRLDLPRMRVSQLLDEWLVARKGVVGESTWITYETYIRLHLKPALGHLPLARLHQRDLQQMYTAMLAHSSATTVNHAHTVLHTALQHGLRMGYVARNPASLATPPRKRSFEVVALTVDEAQRFLRAAAGDRLEALFYVALYTGMRQGELLALRWSSVDLDHGLIQVRGSLRRMHGTLTFGQPKTSRSRRLVAIPDTVIDVLRTHHVRQAQERLRAGAAWQDLDLVFPNQVGGPLEAQNMVRRHFRPILMRAGLRQVRFHDLRHSAATLLLSIGTHPSIVQELLGHSAVAVTLDTYSHVTPNMQRDAVAALHRSLNLRPCTSAGA